MTVPSWLDPRENAPGEVLAGQLQAGANYHPRSLQRFADNQQWAAGDDGDGYDPDIAPLIYQGHACPQSISHRITFIRQHDLLYYSCKENARLVWGDVSADEEDLQSAGLEQVAVNGAKVIDLEGLGIKVGEVYWLESTGNPEDKEASIRWAIEWPGTTRLIHPTYVEADDSWSPVGDNSDLDT